MTQESCERMRHQCEETRRAGEREGNAARRWAIGFSITVGLVALGWAAAIGERQATAQAKIEHLERTQGEMRQEMRQEFQVTRDLIIKAMRRE